MRFYSILLATAVTSLTACSTLHTDNDDTAFSDPEVVEDSAPGVYGATETKSADEVQVLAAEKGQMSTAYSTPHAVENMAVKQEEVVEQFEPVIYFELDAYTLNDAQMNNVKHFAHRMLESQSLKIKVKGHTDERGTPEYNLALGEKRAQSVAQALQIFGVTQDRIEMISYGEEQPVDGNSTEEAWQKNRRAELFIY